MTAKGFNEVFSKLSFSNDTRQVLDSAVVTSLKIYKKEKIIDLKMELPQIISDSYFDTVKNTLYNQLPGINDVLIKVKYLNANSDIKQAIEASWENITARVAKESPACRTMIKDAVWDIEDNNLVITVKNNASFYLIRKKIDSLISGKLAEEENISLSVKFKDEKASEEEFKQYIKKHEETEANLFKALAEHKLNAANAKSEEIKVKTAENISGGILIGKEISGDIVKIRNTKTEGEKVIIEGSVFNMEKREIKGEKYLVSFNITDYTDSTTVKFFVKKDVFDGAVENELKTGKYVKVRGEVQFDKYAKEIDIMARDISKGTPPPKRMDNAKEKRVELHLHTQMSRMDGLTPAKEYIKRAQEWGHSAIAITDHGVVQAFPEAMESSSKSDLKVIYGVEAYLINDYGSSVINPKEQTIDDEFVVFDIETTGLNRETDRITEIGAVKVKNGKIVDTFSSFVNPQVPIPKEITELTRITDEMVADAPTIDKVLPQFALFFGESVLVAHNALFDTGFIRVAANRMGMKLIDNTIIDTVEMAKCLYPELKKYKLNIVCEYLGVELKGHHRAVNDAAATAEMFIKMLQNLSDRKIYYLKDINPNLTNVKNYDKLKYYHAIILVKNHVGLRNLYELISKSHLDYFKRRPRIPKSLIYQYREGLILGSACEAGELYRAMIDTDRPKTDIQLEDIASFYDYLEIQPLGNNKFMIKSQKVKAVETMEDIKNFNKKIVALGEKMNKPVVATCDVHFIDPHDAVYRKIIMTAEGFSDVEDQAPLYLRTTDEMLDEFKYLGEEKAYEVVVKNTNLIADRIEKIKPIPDGTFPPYFEGCEEDLRNICMNKAISMYGDPLPEVVQSRLDRELNSIIGHGYAVLYIIAQRLVWNSNDNGYLVGSRGSVGSSFAANMAGITEVNSLQPHYLCPNCKYSDFTSDIVMKAFNDDSCGCDMPDMNCPKCGHKMDKLGFNIPFETFLGFEGDKEPDIDLNFSGDYQQKAHAYTEVLFGKGKTFKAGTIGTLADKTAYGFVLKYLEKNEKVAHNAEIARLAGGCTGVKRTTGQHPGGIMVVPNDHDIYEFCPIQHPADDVNSNVTTTHFDYHSISGRLLKLDLLGHDDPTVIRMLYDLTGVNPQSVELGDKATMSLFESPAALGVTAEDIGCETGTLGIPEFGTKFVRQMLLDTKPKTFADLLRISGLSHGTDVWLGNAQELIAQGTITLKESIATRDSIMTYLINKGVPNKPSFKIMEKVRKGKGLTPEDIALMKEHDVPQWYIDSCLKIKYMFPKAHAAAYVMNAFRIAYFKINYPLAYYAAYFTVRACDDFDYSCMCVGMEEAKRAEQDILDKGMSATTKEKNKLTVLEIIIEFYARGFSFKPIDLYKSDSKKFIIDGNSLIPPFNSLQGLGTNAAQSIVDGRGKTDEFKTIEEFNELTSLGKTLTELLKENGVLNGIPETNQLTLF